jgi:Kef-type K+ transport system membrane component KefB
MIKIYFYSIVTFWFLAALISTILANRLKISMALLEIIIGSLIGYATFKFNLTGKLSLNSDWMKFLAGTDAVMLTFLVGIVITSAVIPTLVANKFFLSKNLLEVPILNDQLPEIGPEYQ